MSANRENHWKTLLAGTLSVAAILAPNAAQAQQAQPQQQVAQATGPVTAISELTDVQPTDWAFQALQSLVERYGCIAGYPDRTYRGNRAMTRFEFAAGMNACLDRINELIAAGLADKVSKEDLATLQRLQEEFQAELAALRGRVDKLEGDVKKLQGQVFNPVTRLTAEVLTVLVGSALSENRDVNGDGIIGNAAGEFRSNQANMTLPFRVRLNFDASFVGTDRLRVRLQARDFETRFFPGDTRVAGAGGSPSSNFTLSLLSYRFRAFGNITAFVAPKGTGIDELYLNTSPFTAISRFAANISPATSGVNFGDGGAGFRVALTDQFNLTYGYASDAPTTLGSGFGDSGIGGGSSSQGVELAFTPTKDLGIFFQFATTYLQNGTAAAVRNFATGTNGSNLFRGPLYRNPEGFAPATARVNAFTVATTWNITPQVIFGGWFTAGTVDYKLPARVPVGAVAPGSEDINGFQAGFAFRDVFLQGSQAGVVIGQPIVTAASGVYNSRPFIVDVYYSFPVGRNLTLTPGAYFISNPNGGRVGRANDPTIGVGALRALFSF